MNTPREKSVQSLHELAFNAKAETAPVLLAIFAHPDDETFTAGGTLALHAARGWRVKLVCVTHGEKGRAGRGGLSDEAYKQLRADELREAARHLGVDELMLFDWGDGEVSKRPAEQTIAELLAIMQRTRPAVVLTFGPDGISGHADHVAISQRVTSAFHHYRREMAHAEFLPQLYYVVRSPAIPSCCVQLAETTVGLPVTIRIDIRSVWQRKMKAMQAYRSQSHLLTTLRKDPKAWRAREEFFHQAFPATLPEPKLHKRTFQIFSK